MEHLFALGLWYFTGLKKPLKGLKGTQKKNKKEYDIESDWKVFAFAANMCEYT